MWKTSIVISILLCSIINQAKALDLKFDVHVSTNTANQLELGCDYTLDSNSILDKVVMRKDGITFIEFNEANKNDPTSTLPNGIAQSDFMVHKNGCRVTIKNINDKTLGLYELNLFYDTGTVNPKMPGANRAAKKYQVNYLGACTQNWITGTPGNIPTGAVVATKNNGSDLIVCRGKVGNSNTPGYLIKEGCIVTYGNKVDLLVNYEVLTGKGFQFVKSDGQDVLKYAFKAVNEGDTTIYIGRCYIQNDVFIGKKGSASTFWYAYNNQEKSDCPNDDILLCKQ